jgi:DNA-binding IclR family transcriptional regulator
MASEKIEGSGRRLILLLEVISQLEPEFSLKELTALAQLPSTTVHRLLQVLLETGMVERAGQGYRRGVTLLRLASMLLQNVHAQRAAEPVVSALWQAWQETAAFAVYRPHTRTAMVVHSISAPHPLRCVFEPYAELSLAWGSFGRAILAHLPPQELDAVLAARAKGPLSGRAPPAPEVLLEAVANIRRGGYAFYEDPSLNIAGAAAPVFGPDRTVVGAVGVALPAQRLSDYDQDALFTAVRDSGLRVSAAIGWAPIQFTKDKP